jgi:putative addiction module component (TIGR02574 family)
VDVYTESIHGLSAAEKLALVERIWDDLAADPRPLPIPAWAALEAVRRRDEMIGNPAIGKTHDEAWAQIRAGRTVGVFTLGASEIRKLDGSEILHARRVSA